MKLYAEKTALIAIVWLVFAVAGLASVGVAASEAKAAADRRAQSSAEAKRCNVLVLYSDDQQWDTIGALGHPVVKTPNLDRLVKRGFVFRNHYVMGAMGGAVCIPSRAMFHSGRSLWRVANDMSGVPLWGELVQQAGYQTFATGKWHNGPESLLRSFKAGKAIFLGGMSDHFAVPVQDILPDGRLSEKYVGRKFSSQLFADAAIEFLEKRDRSRPFFLYVAFTAPHDPRTPPAEFAKMYAPNSIPLPKNFLPQHPFDTGEMWGRDEMLAPHPRTPEVVRQHLADYYGMISHMDQQIGRVLQALANTGDEPETLLVFAGDNGLAVGQHGLLGKQNLYEHSGRTPLVFAGPGIPSGRSDALVYLHDILPTVCELVGLSLPEGIDGKSLVPVIRGQKQQVREFVFTAYRNLQRAVREPRWKLIKYHIGGVKTTQLFDLETDPWETNNLADDPACAEHRKRLEARLEKARREAGDPVDFENVGGKPSGPRPTAKKTNAK